MKEIILKIDGMHCTGCSTRLENALKNKKGIIDAKVSFDTKEAHIKYKKIDKEKIEAYINEIGFKSLGE